MPTSHALASARPLRCRRAGVDPDAGPDSAPNAPVLPHACWPEALIAREARMAWVIAGACPAKAVPTFRAMRDSLVQG
jgi:hypothetical protein